MSICTEEARLNSAQIPQASYLGPDVELNGCIKFVPHMSTNKPCLTVEIVGDQRN